MFKLGYNSLKYLQPMPAAINGKMVVFCLMSMGQSAAYSSKAKTKINTKEVLKAKVLFFHTSEGLMVM